MLLTKNNTTKQIERVGSMNSNKILRAYSIKEVSKKINIPTGTIRQWEKDLHGLLIIPRTQQGSRYFTETEINLLKKIKEMRAQNVSKGLIRSLLEKHFSTPSETISEPLELSVSSKHENNELIHHETESSIADLTALMDKYKHELVKEMKLEIAYSREQMMAAMKSELESSSLHSIKELSKSIQRANVKRTAELQEISNAINTTSEHTSESFETIADIHKLTASLDENQEKLLSAMHDLKQSTEEIQQREEIFQGMLASYREVASAKARKKNWWRLWS